MNDISADAPFSVGDWRIDPHLRQMTRGVEVVRVDPRNMRVLQLLASRAGDVVSQSEIEKIAWSGVAVTPDSVYQSIAQLRRALGEDKAAPRYIETVPRKGYRLIVPVGREVLASASPPAATYDAPLPAAEGRTKGRRLKRISASIALAAAVAAVSVVVWFVRSGEQPSAAPTARTELPQGYRGDSKIRQAIAYLEALLKTQSETNGAEDPGLVTPLSRLANLYLLVSDPRRSEVAARRGLGILEKHGGTRSAEGVELHATLAEALADLQQYEDAESHLQTALQLAREVHGETDEATVDAINQLALLRIAQHRFEDAERLARSALDTHRRLPEPGTARAAFLTSTLAWALIEQGRASEAIGPMDAALDAIKPDDPPAPYLVALAHHFRGEALNHVGRHSAAEADFRTELDLYAKIAHVKMDEARALSALAEARFMQGAVSEAASLLSKAQAMLEDGEGWRESKARHETAVRLRQLRDLGARTETNRRAR